VSLRTWITTVLALVGGVFMVRFGMTFPWARTLNALARSDWTLLAGAAAANIGSLVAKGAAWYLLLRRFGAPRPSTAVVATFVGAAVNSVSVSLSGEAARAQFVTARDGLPFRAAVASLVMTRLAEAVGLVVFLSAALLVVPTQLSAPLIGLAVALVLAALVVAYRVGSWNRRGVLGAVALTAVNWLAQWATYHWSIEAVHARVTPAASLMTLIASNLGGILRLTPGNLGVVQGSLIVVLPRFHISTADALAAGLALQAVQLLPILVIGMAIAGRGGLRRLAAASS
jgi:uncharacterized membrane protein YbhN (UPF0104 family)